MRPVILISGNRTGEGSGMNYSLRDLYARSVAEAGGLPVLALGGDAGESACRADGLLLSGGLDMDPSYYGEEPLDENVEVQKERDEYEKELFEAFVSARKPVFGICRGIQAINVFLSGSLWQDLPKQRNLMHSGGLRHPVEVNPGNALYRLYGPQFAVNSFHHQAVREPGRGLQVLCVSGDGIIEAVRHESLPVAGVQWHPERMAEEDGYPDMTPLFKRFIDRCGKADGDGGYL